MLNKRWKGNIRRWAVELVMLGTLVVVFATVSGATIVPNAVCIVLPQDPCMGHGDEGIPYLECDPNPTGHCIEGCQGSQTRHQLQKVWRHCKQYIMCADGYIVSVGNCADPWLENTGQCCD